MRTLEVNMQPSMMMNLEEVAKAEGKTPQLIIISILNDYFKTHKLQKESTDKKLKMLRGSLAAVNQLDLSADERAKQILQK